MPTSDYRPQSRSTDSHFVLVGHSQQPLFCSFRLGTVHLDRLQSFFHPRPLAPSWSLRRTAVQVCPLVLSSLTQRSTFFFFPDRVYHRALWQPFSWFESNEPRAGLPFSRVVVGERGPWCGIPFGPPNAPRSSTYCLSVSGSSFGPASDVTPRPNPPPVPTDINFVSRLRRF